MRALTSSLALAALLVISTVAKADTLFQFSASGGIFSTTGTLTGTSNGDGSYTIKGISGTGITQLVNAGANFFADNDNLLFPANPRQLNVQGLAFDWMSGTQTYEVNLYTNLQYNPPSNFVYYADLVDGSGNVTESQATFSASAVTPEPSSLLLMGTGALALAAQLRRRYVSA